MPTYLNYGWEEEVIDPEEELKRTSDQDKGPELESITDIENETQDIGDQYEEDLGMEVTNANDDEDPEMGAASYRRRKSSESFYGVEEYTEDIGVDTGSDDSNVEEVTIEETPPAEEVTEEVAPETTNLDVTAEVAVEPAEVTEDEVTEDAVNEETGEMNADQAVENWANKIGIYGLENDDPVTIHVETGEIDKEITLEGSNVSINDGGDSGSSDDEMPEEIDDGTSGDGNANAEGGDNGGNEGGDNNQAGNESLSNLEYLIGF